MSEHSATSIKETGTATGDMKTTLATRDPQDGLAWDEQLFSNVPVWTREPSEAAIERTCRKHFGLMDSDTTCTISFFASGAFNKLYLFTSKHEKALMRVSLPVYPTHKTRGEVTTLRWVRENTDIPVPRVLAFDDTNNNAIGFEWILMELMPGKTAYRNWRKMTMGQKTAFVEKIANYQAQLARAAARHGFDTIGTLSNKESTSGRPETGSPQPKVRPHSLVTHQFFLGNRLKLDVSHGPFSSSREWITTLLDMIVKEQTRIANEITDDEDSDKEEADETIAAAKNLLRVLPQVFPEQDCLTNNKDNSSTADHTYLYHDDLNLKNILLDEDGNISAIVDWECVSALPLWMSTRMPRFLRDSERWEEPNPDQYGRDDEDSRIPGEPSGDEGEDALDNEGKPDLYWIHRGEYEATVLGKAFRDNLGELWPGWKTLEESGLLKSYFYEAVLSCASGFFLNGISQWIHAIETGTVVRDGKILSWSDF